MTLLCLKAITVWLDKVRIKVVAANLAKRQLDYEWVVVTAITDETGQEEAKRIHEKKKGGKKAKKKK